MPRPPRILRNRTVSICATLGALAALFSWTLESSAVGTRHFVIETGEDFGKGELSGVAVDSAGFLRPGWDLGSIEVSDAQSVWSVLPHASGLLLGTGSEAKILQVKAGKVEELTRVKGALAVTSIVEAFGKVIVGAMPGGKLYELKGDKLEEFTKLGEDEHVWDLAFDESQKALYVATGPEGKLYRVTNDGTAQVYFDSPQDHLVSVAARAGRVYAGSSGEARLYQVMGPGRASVLHDFSSTEVRDIALGKSGSIYAIANELTGGPRTDSVEKTVPSGPGRKTAKSGSGKLFRFHENGQPEELHADSSEHFVSLSLDEIERPILGTGGNGKLIRLELDHQSAVLADVESRQVTAIFGPEGKGWVIASDPVVVHPVEAVGGKEALWTSEVLDAGIRARFGRLSWDADGRVELSTRTGNTKEPDETWKDWSIPLVNFGPVTSEAGRYLQVRARLVDGEKSRVRRIEVPFVTDNLRPILTEVTAKSGATSAGSKGVVSSGGPVSEKPSSKIKLSWEVTNPDEDSLRYRVSYQLAGQSDWVDAHESTEVLTGTSWDWDTEDLPEGRYRVRVTATDELSNPPSRVKSHQRESEVILVDNTPPRLENVVIKGSSLSGVALDGVGPVRRLELKAAGQSQWIPFESKDGIFDQAQEDFSFDLSKLALPAGGLLTVRAFDTAGNIELRHVRLPTGD
jgi:hypothetical protein